MCGLAEEGVGGSFVVATFSSWTFDFDVEFEVIVPGCWDGY